MSYVLSEMGDNLSVAPGCAHCALQIRYQTVEGKRLRLQIWDTAGQERFRNITTSYFTGAHGILLVSLNTNVDVVLVDVFNAVVQVYDVMDRRSFSSVCYWLDQIRQHAATGTIPTTTSMSITTTTTTVYIHTHNNNGK